MKVDLSYVQAVKARGRIYYYFRKGVVRFRLPGQHGSREFEDAYETALRTHAPDEFEARRRQTWGGRRGSVVWVIEQFKARSPQWRDATGSTREVYDRRHHWLTKNYGSEQIADFDRDMLKQMRDLPEFSGKPSVADATIERFGTLWDFAEEFLHLENMRVHQGINPARNIRKLKEGAGESAPLWPLDLCWKIEAHQHADIVTFYFLARYTGQRRSDLVTMKWEHIDTVRNEMFVVQLKTRARIWVPMPKRLVEHLAKRERTGDYIVMSPKHKGEPWEETSLTNELNRVTRELGFVTTDSKGKPRYYSPHGLRHLCGVELAHAGASDRQIAAVLGHSTMKQVAIYVAQAQQRLLARGAQQKRDEMYEKEELETLIDIAGNVVRMRA
jgi:integrase